MISRAEAAYFRKAAREGYRASIPSGNSGGLIIHDGKLYVLVVNVNGIMRSTRVPQQRRRADGAQALARAIEGGSKPLGRSEIGHLPDAAAGALRRS